MYGYAGKMLFVNLSTGDIETRELTEDLVKNFPGGPALGAKILYDEMPAKCDIFGEDSMVGIVTGPLTGTKALFSGRYTVVSKSPVYKGWNDANSGGFFAPMFKKSGYDALFVKGIAEKPVYIFIDNGKVEIRDASHLWGMTVLETEEALREEIGDKKIEIALIAPAGERLSHMAAVMNDGHRAAARGGTGAVFGSKKLKAVVCKGTMETPVYDKEKMLALNKKIVDNLKNGPAKAGAAGLSAFGTAGIYVGSVLSGDAGTKNWGGAGVTDMTEEGLNKLASPTTDPLYKTSKYACAYCPIGCGAMYSVESERYPMLKHTSRPEYETVGLFGSLLLNEDAESVIAANHLCNEYGFDTISACGTIGWLMECYNEGVFTKEDYDGIELPWGDGTAAVKMLEKMCKGEGCGAVFQHGSQYAANYFGKGHEFLAVASGIEESAHDSRFAPGLARTYQYDPTPGRHTKGGYGPGQGNLPAEVKHDPTGKGFGDTLKVSDRELINATGLCTMGAMGIFPGMRREMLHASTGISYTPLEEYMQGIRSYTMRHAFNLREGLKREDFTLSERLVAGPDRGPLANVVIKHEEYADTFFENMHWHPKTMVPAKEALEFLGGLENVCKDLYPPPPPPPAPKQEENKEKE